MKTLAFALLLLTWSSQSLAAGLKLTIHDGLVSIDAEDVTVRQILTEWARVGKTRIINVERLSGGPITLKVDSMPERQALDVVLRTIPGYLAMPRTSPVADGSLYDSIVIMATTTAVAPLRPQQPSPGFPGMQSAVPGIPGGMVTQLRPNPPTSLSPGMLPEMENPADQADDPAIAAAAAAGLIPIPAFTPGSPTGSAPLAPPTPAGQQRPSQPAPGAGAPTNPFNVPAGTAQPSLAPPPAPTPAQAAPTSRVRPPQADR